MRKAKRNRGHRRIGPSVRALYRAQDGFCFYCGGPMSLDKPPANRRHPDNMATKDHLYPHAAGCGKKWNVVAACLACNMAKGAALPTERHIERYRELYGCDPRYHDVREQIERTLGYG